MAPKRKTTKKSKQAFECHDEFHMESPAPAPAAFDEDDTMLGSSEPEAFNVMELDGALSCVRDDIDAELEADDEATDADPDEDEELEDEQTPAAVRCDDDTTDDDDSSSIGSMRRTTVPKQRDKDTLLFESLKKRIKPIAKPVFIGKEVELDCVTDDDW